MLERPTEHTYMWKCIVKKRNDISGWCLSLKLTVESGRVVLKDIFGHPSLLVVIKILETMMGN